MLATAGQLSVTVEEKLQSSIAQFVDNAIIDYANRNYANHDYEDREASVLFFQTVGQTHVVRRFSSSPAELAAELKNLS